MQLVALLIGDSRIRDAVAAALRAHAHVQRCLSRRRLLTVTHRCTVAAVVLGLRTTRGEMNVAFVNTLRQRYPVLPIVGVGGGFRYVLDRFRRVLERSQAALGRSGALTQLADATLRDVVVPEVVGSRWLVAS
jgi:hypothetical protein